MDYAKQHPAKLSFTIDWIHFVHPPKLRFENTKNEKKRSSELGVFFLF